MKIGLADTITHLLMRLHGFQYFKTTSTSLQVLPLRPATWIEPARSPAKDMAYWVRPHTSKTRLPIVYIHGIGIGLVAQVGFLRELDKALNEGHPEDGEVGILAIEILQISSRLMTAIPTRAQSLEQLTAILDFHGYDRFVLCSHSYGSVLSTHILNNSALASRVSSTLLVDPVTVLLHMPDVAYNFTVRNPKTAAEWELWYFASKDPCIAHTLGRHFFWSENVLWRDRLTELVRNGMRVTASLASKDLIVDTESVGTYLMENQIPDPVFKIDSDGRQHMELQTPDAPITPWKQRPWRGQNLDVMWWEGLDHAQVFDTLDARSKLVDVLIEYSKGT